MTTKQMEMEIFYLETLLWAIWSSLNYLDFLEQGTLLFQDFASISEDLWK